MTDQRKDNLKWWILFTVIIGTFLGRLDQTIVGLAMPKIMDDFGITVSSAAWISTAYIIANAVFVPIWGKLGDIWGRKKIYLFGFIVFIIGSVLCSISWNLPSMIIFRIIQAIAGSADYPTAMAIIAFTFKEGRERAQALGIWSSSFAAAAVFGPLVGGPLIDNFNWPSVFWINLPIGIIGIIMALIFINESKEESAKKDFDWQGALVLGVGLAALVLVLERGLDWGWLSYLAIASYATVIISLISFIYIEKKKEDPIVDLKFFKNGLFVNALLNNFIIFMGMMSVIYLIPLFAQIFLGYGATKTGYLFMPMAAAMMIAAPIGGQFSKPKQIRWVIFFSSLLSVVGIFLFTGLEAKSGPLDIIIPLVIMAFGMGFGMAQRTNIISASVPANEIGSASSVLSLVRSIAGAFGIAIVSTLLDSASKDHALALAHSSTINVLNPQIYQQFVSLIVLQSQILAYHTVFWVGAAIVLVGTVTALWIKVPENAQIKKVAVE